MSKSKAERHLALGDMYMNGGAYERAFRLYNSALGNYQKVSDIEGQRLALTKMTVAAEAWGNGAMAENCRNWLKDLEGCIRSFHCKKCDLDFDYDVGDVAFQGAVPAMEKTPVCPSCGREIKANDVLFEAMMAAKDAPHDVLSTVDRLVSARSWDQRRTVLESNPVLLTQEAEDVLKSNLDIARSMGVGDQVKGDEQLHWLVKRCREVGVARTFEELEQ